MVLSDSYRNNQEYTKRNGPLFGIHSFHGFIMRSTNSEINNVAEFSFVDDLSLSHLQIEITRIDVMIRRAIYYWQLAGQDPADAFRGLYISDQDADALIERPISTNWSASVDIQSEDAQVFIDALEQANLQIKGLVESAKMQRKRLRLEHLANVTKLSPFDVDVLLIALAPNLDLRYESLYGYLQDNITSKRPSINLVLDLLCDPGPERFLRLSHFRDDAPLFKNHLLEFTPENGSGSVPLLRQTIAVDQSIASWLLGHYRPHPNLRIAENSIRTDLDPSDELLNEEIEELDDIPDSDPPLLVFYGPDQIRQDAAARVISAHKKRKLFVVELSAHTGDGRSAYNMITLALRDALITNSIPYITGWDSCLIDHSPAPDVFAKLCLYPDLAIIAGKNQWQPGNIQRDRILRWINFPAPSYFQRLALWEHYLSPYVDPGTLNIEPLASQFQFTTGKIRDAAASARDIGAQRGNQLKDEYLFISARGHSNPHLAGLARKISPRYGWDDIVLPGDQLDLLREIVATVRCRPKVLDEWGVGKKLASSRGVTVLFAGPPGTGKTMAAEIISSELGLDLYKIDLSTVVSKYIGETEKNLERIFNEAETSNAILFFDEADALFGKRSEVRDSHDRYANIEISYLLQRMEAYNGVTILATNLGANMDDAFTRRLQFSVDFPFPERADRLRIWHTLFPPNIPVKEVLDFEFMADRFKIAGGNIRNIIISAAYLAADDGQQITMELLMHGTRRELQKMGRLVDEIDIFT